MSFFIFGFGKPRIPDNCYAFNLRFYWQDCPNKCSIYIEYKKEVKKNYIKNEETYYQSKVFGVIKFS